MEYFNDVNILGTLKSLHKDTCIETIISRRRSLVVPLEYNLSACLGFCLGLTKRMQQKLSLILALIRLSSAWWA